MLRLRLVGVAAPYWLARGRAKMSSGTIRHWRSLNKAVSQKLELISNSSFFFCLPSVLEEKNETAYPVHFHGIDAR